MRLTNCLVEASVFDGGGNESERKVQSLEADEVCLSFVQNVEVRKSELLRVHCIKLLKETVLKLDSGLGLFIAVPNSVIVSHVSIRPVSMVRKIQNTYF